MSKFNVGDKVVVNSNYPGKDDVGKFGIYTGNQFDDGTGYCVINGVYSIPGFFREEELDFKVTIKDCVDNDVSVGDKIVYFTRSGSSMWPNTATVTEIITGEVGAFKASRIKVDVTEKKMSGDVHRKTTLESLRNAVKVDWK